MRNAKWKYIKDPVHGLIRISVDDLKIIDTPLFQRLRNIHHMGTGYLTYPGATHTRFEHSLGVAELGKSVLDSIICNSHGDPKTIWDIEDDELEIMKKTVRYACLLHDIGHAPFSHTCESFFRDEVKKITPEITSKINFLMQDGETSETILIKKADHEVVSCYIVLTEYKTILEGLGVDPRSVGALILGRVNKEVNSKYHRNYKILAEIVNSPIDVDKFDYLIRDNYMTGAALISLDRERLLSAYIVSEESLVLSGKALSLISNLIIGRQQVYMWIYQHHKVVYTNALLEKILKALIQNGKIKPDFFSVNSIVNKKIDDFTVISEIRRITEDDSVKDIDNIKDMYNTWRTRKFLKSCWKNAFEFNSKIKSDNARKNLNTDVIRPRNLEEKISQAVGINRENILVAGAKFVPFAPGTGLDISIEIDGINKDVATSLELTTQGVMKYCQVPYVYTEESKIDDVIKYLQTYTTSFH
ncbi:MAG: HD domain-containing protein [Methanoregula sp.]